MSDRPDSIAIHYHERTKYHPDTIATKNRSLDWSSQPTPFKDYKIGAAYDLKPYLNKEKTVNKQTEDYQWQRLSRLFAYSYGLTAKITTMGEPIYLRSSPSAGGLYPAEMYLLSRGTPLLKKGLYSYQPKTHTLVHFWDNEVWSTLREACFNHPALEKTKLAIITTAIFYRSAWRYEDRAYRRIFLDTGHLLGNIELCAAMTGYRPYLIGGFQDVALNELMYLDPEQEGVLTVIPLLDQENDNISPSVSITALPSPINTNYPQLKDGELLGYLHQASEIRDVEGDLSNFRPNNQKKGEDSYNLPFCLKVPLGTQPIDWGKNLSGLERTILQRRSTRAYTGGDITLDDLKALLNFTYHPEAYPDQGFDDNPDYFDLNLLETFIAVSGVIGLEEGCYYYARHAQELRQIRFKNFQSELHYLSLGQELGRDAAAIIFQTADLGKAVEKYGDRAYRYLHLDAGHLGQRLNLAAIHLNLGVSGIAGFFDDQVNEVLGIPEDEAVIYLTTLGQPKWGN
ncbi:MAG: SagB/ThcOx family dehydrogenase [Microcystaceae cyanobacterium]